VLRFEARAAAAHVAPGVAATMAVAILSLHRFEKHFLRLERYFEYTAPVQPLPSDKSPSVVTG
jgi:hypothetical protein